MGAGASVSPDSDASTIADAVKTIAPAYAQYKEPIENNGIDGATLLAMESVDEVLTEVGVTSKMHVARLQTEFAKFKKSAAPSTGDGSAESPPDTTTASALDDLIARAKNIQPKSLQDVVGDESYHLFISYRQASEKAFANRLFDGVRAMTVDKEFGAPGVKPNIFLDVRSLKDGEPWEEGFIRGILSSTVVLPLMTWYPDDSHPSSLGQMVGLTETNDRVDNVLLEWEVALALQGYKESRIKSIFPIMFGGTDSRGFLKFPFANLSRLPDIAHVATKRKLLEICEQRGIPLSEEAIRRTVKGVANALLVNQGVQMSEWGNEDNAINTAVNKAFEKGAEFVVAEASKVEAPAQPAKRIAPSGAAAAEANRVIDPQTGGTILMQAAANGDVNQLKNLVDMGADIDAKNYHGNTAIQWASGGGHAACVRMLIDSGANINVVDNDGDTPLIAATVYNHTSCAKMLIEAGANVNVANNNGCTALIYASARGNTAVVSSLLALDGIDVNARATDGDYEGETALGVADNETIEKLLKKKMNIKNDNGDY